MSLLNFLKKTKKSKTYEQKKAKKPQQSRKESSVLEKEEKKEKEPIKAVKPKKGKISENSYKIFSAPLITEKTSLLEKENKYVFKVFPKANKISIKQAIEDIYKVNVLAVKIINIPKKPRKMGRHKIWKKGYKKAIIKLKEGQRIEILSR
jgi:large subunit ribosomal protein L23